MMKKNSSGFSLIELMVVVAILSLAAAILVPYFLKDRMKKKQEECRQNLKTLLLAEKAYLQKHNTFTTDLNQLQWKAEGKGYYQYHFLPNPPQKNGFLFECIGNIDRDATIDRTQIVETGKMTQVVDDLKQ